MNQTNKSQKAGWFAISFSITITSLWAFWGANEAFHEGWHYQTFLMNLGLTVIQYLSPMLIFLSLGLISIYWPRLGGAIHFAVALFAAWFFDIFSNTVIVFILLPLVGVGILYWRVSLPPRKIAMRWMVVLPIFVLLAAGFVPAYRVSQRIDHRSPDAQLVVGNGVTLTWAPSGPGWPREGASWAEANRVCQSLSEDGLSIEDQPQNIWRLPTVDEAVRSMSFHGENSHGVWDDINAVAAYQSRSDKEFPLWDIYSQIIYWWTATEVDQERAYMIVYDGIVWPRSKQMDIGTLGFRCVK